MFAAQRDYGGGEIVMAALAEEGRYRVSCCGRDGTATSVLHVKLTETVYRALKNYQNSKNALSSRPTIQFKGQQGSVRIPRADDPSASASFDFFVSRVGKDGPQGSFECVRQDVSGDVPLLSCMGVVQDKITLCASSSHDPPQRPPQAEVGMRKRETKPAKPADGPSTGKRVPFRKPAPSSSPSDLVPERKRSTPVNPAALLRKGPPNPPPVSQARYRDRVVHLLALRPHKKLAVLARLQRDKINPKDLGSTLQQVANLNPKDNTYSLKDHLYRDVRRDWPGYSEEEREQLGQILASKFGTQCESPSTKSPKESIPTSQQRGQECDFIDPLMPKKSRISHISSRAPVTPPPSDGHAPSKEDKPAPPAPHLPASNPPLPLSSRSPSTPEGCGTQALPVDAQSSRVDQSRSSSTPAPSPAPALAPGSAPTLEQREGGGSKKPKKRSKKRKEREESPDLPTTKIAKSDREESTEAPVRSMEVTSTDVIPDYLHKFTAVTSMTQRQSYKDDFNAEYGEYCALHARVEKVTRRFTQLDSQCKLLQPGTKEHKEVQEEVLQEYNKMKRTSPSYREMKQRCEHLHNKLAHIKRLIAEFDQQRARTWDYCADAGRDGRAIPST
ncbi:RNA polymerase II elongation factor ELL2 isoform X2 [Anguilla anguilla]|uniref:RNA polymerase II elongation factor ELL2 isoform X2 n=1 Tax=Anguilla anguilla TaxID=7936 RepID=UPI0015ABC0F7|nr:RNA polymerase II elongation factor ELL2 isoform X2 [Anguilla anguilla]